MKYSIIIPVFNRPDEVDELLQSLCEQTEKDFEVLIGEDGSQRDCKAIVEKYHDRLPEYILELSLFVHDEEEGINTDISIDLTR